MGFCFFKIQNQAMLLVLSCIENTFLKYPPWSPTYLVWWSEGLSHNYLFCLVQQTGKKKTKKTSQLHTGPWKIICFDPTNHSQNCSPNESLCVERRTNHSKGGGRAAIVCFFSFVEKKRKPIPHPSNTILHTFVKKKQRKKGFIHPQRPLLDK